MAYEHKWSIDRVDGYPEKYGLKDVVAVVHWELQVTDPEDRSMHWIRGTTELGMPNPENYTDYLELSPAEILPWVWHYASKEELEAQIDQELDDMRNPSARLQTFGMPWLADCCPDGEGIDVAGAISDDNTDN